MSRTHPAADPSPKLRLVRGNSAEADLSLSPRIAARLALVGLVGGRTAHPRRPASGRAAARQRPCGCAR
jgi:hypothetical protein